MNIELKDRMGVRGNVIKNGAFIKPLFFSIPKSHLFNNIADLIFQQQQNVFPYYEAQNNISFPKSTGSNYFPRDLIYTEITPSPNKSGIWIDGKKRPAIGQTFQTVEIEVQIYLSFGNHGKPGHNSTTYNDIGLEAIFALLSTVNASDLLQGWPMNVPSDQRVNYVNTIGLDSAVIIDRDISDPENNRVYPIGSLQLLYKLTSVRN